MVFATVITAMAKGLLAGVAGTAAMTLSSTVEAKIRGRDPSTAPADAAGKVLGVKPVGAKEQTRFATLVHWGYGTGWGAPRGLLAAARLPAPLANAVHLALVWGTETTMLPALEVAPPINEWEYQEIAIDVFHHLVYAMATGRAYAALDRAIAS
ncbi:hypothetical protein [Sporichthya sp.]|uniref:hypothetical protein n=1 Tax=Sporichthya sp. TaxID=65475 RepID=UPI0017DCA519|nr:hypothetical protein [Sporichthya sp.]MBA3743216.1 hypothetical protein [Sporichthya sp.]